MKCVQKIRTKDDCFECAEYDKCGLPEKLMGKIPIWLLGGCTILFSFIVYCIWGLYLILTDLEGYF